MSDCLPNGYRVIEKRDSSIIIGMFDFMLMFDDAKQEISYEGNKYRCGCIEVIPKALAGYYCSCREYLLIKEVK